MKSTYIEGILELVQDGVVYTHWDQTAAATGRLTSCSPNLQAVPKTSIVIKDFDNSIIIGQESCWHFFFSKMMGMDLRYLRDMWDTYGGMWRTKSNKKKGVMIDSLYLEIAIITQNCSYKGKINFVIYFNNICMERKL